MEEEKKEEFLKSWSHPFLTHGCDKNNNKKTQTFNQVPVNLDQ